MHISIRHHLLTVLSLALVAATSCSTTSNMRANRYDFPADHASQSTLDDWFAGDLTADKAPQQRPGDQAGIEEIFSLAEIAYWNGNVERAGRLYLRMLDQQPSHPLNRFAAVRLNTLSDELVNFYDRVGRVIRTIKFGEVEPLTAVYLSLLGQRVSRHHWKISDTEHPFATAPLGIANRWMATPMLSPWRLLDFDRDFAAEHHSSLHAEYLSPYVAEDAPVNYQRSRPFMTTGSYISPDFDRSGIHYMETFATVDPSKANGGDYLVYARMSSATRVWIDGKPVISRTEHAYGPHKRLRRVHLSAGQHRILIKVAYQRGSRDWMDFALLGDQATPVSGSGLSFSNTPARDANGGTITRTSDLHKASALEPLLVGPDQVGDAGDMELFLTASAGFFEGERQYFDAAIGELMKRHENFAPGYLLRARQTPTLWEMPSQLRDAQSLADLRRAHQLDPTNLEASVQLIERLRQQDSDARALRPLLENARNAAVTTEQSDEPATATHLRNIAPLVEWADWLGDNNWPESAEKAWRRVLQEDPSHCQAAQRLQQLYYQRSHYPGLDAITAEHPQCPLLARRLARKRPDMADERMASYRKQSRRYPFNRSAQSNYADELLAQGRPDDAQDVLAAARDRMPWKLVLWNKLANRAMATSGRDAALEILQNAIDQNGASGWLQWRMSMLRNDLPLQEIMPDGLAAARAEVEHARSDNEEYAGDEAYYTLDFAARKYFDDGSSVDLTHTVVRVLTKGAIDRYGEFSTPDGARLVLARTIKADGSTRVPHNPAGKSTLSMPGLAPGDFVETAYVQYHPPNSLSKTGRSGVRFFFRMGDISSVHSEYVVLNPGGKFWRMNDAPEAEPVETAAGKGVRFLRTDSPRPRKEPATVSGSEFLPWIQLYRDGAQIEPFEANRLDAAETIRDNLKSSRPLDAQIARWRRDLEPGTAREVKQLFYRVAHWFPDPSTGNFGASASHAVLEHDGNSLLVLKAAYDKAGIPAEIYRVKTKTQAPTDYPTDEWAKYQTAVLKVGMPDGQNVWLLPYAPDAMFGTVALSQLGQPAVCVSCQTPTRDTVAETTVHDSNFTYDVSGQLSPAGDLTGTMTITGHGLMAAFSRGMLRKRQDDNRRKKFIDKIVSGVVSGASLQDYQIRGEHAADQPLAITAEFVRQHFARPVEPGTLRIQSTLFREALASRFASLSRRYTPMLVRGGLDRDYSFRMTLPDSYDASLDSKTGQWSFKSRFGDFTRSATIESGTLTVTSAIDMPTQRVSPTEYGEFQTWAVGIERSSLVQLTLDKKQ